MPYFSYNVEDLNISPDEFLEQCSKREQTETYNLLIENYGFGLEDNIDTDLEDNYVRSEAHRVFLKSLQSLKQNWYSINKEDAQIIDIIAKKYGSI